MSVGQPPMGVRGGESKFERRRDARLTFDDLKDVSVEVFVEIAKDKWKSRSLQRSLMESDEVRTSGNPGP